MAGETDQPLRVRFGRTGRTRTCDPLLRRERDHFQKLHRLFLVFILYYNLGNLLFA
jgi:hypothetical protein